MDIPKLNSNLYGSLVKVFVFVNADLAGAADLLHVLREGTTGLFNQGVEFWLPLIPNLFDLVIEFREGSDGVH